MLRPADEIPMVDFFARGSALSRLRALRENRLHFLQAIAADRREILRQPTLGWNVVLPLTPALVHQVLVENARAFEKSPVLRISLNPLVGQGLFTSEGELWKRQRKLMAPLFHPAQMKHYAACMTECAVRAAEEIRDGIGGPEGVIVDVARMTTRITMAVAGMTLFEADTFAEADELGEALTVALDWTSFAATSEQTILQARLKIALDRSGPHLPAFAQTWAENASSRLLRPVLFPTRRNAALRRAIRVLEERVQRMIAERRNGSDRGDLLSRLLAARDDEDGGHMTDRQVRDEILTLFVAGHETTATALAWALYELVREPELLSRARGEADALGHAPAFEDLARLPLAGRIFKESLRKYPPVFMFGRVATETVEVGGYALGAGSIVLICPFAIQRRPELYPDPERFDPDRFLPEVEATRPREAFLPFSWGPRTCIGNHFALMEGPLVLATLLQRLDLRAPEGAFTVVPDPSATLRPRGGVNLRVRKRTSN